MSDVRAAAPLQKRKKVNMFIRLSILLLAGTLVWGQTQGKQAAAQRLQYMSTQLGLTEDQKEKIMPILMEEAPKAQAVKADTTLPQNEKVAKMMEIRNETNDRVKPLLTSAQQKKLDDMRAQERQRVMQELKAAKQ
jgi:hypothetical protein